MLAYKVLKLKRNFQINVNRRFGTRCWVTLYFDNLSDSILYIYEHLCQRKIRSVRSVIISSVFASIMVV